MRLVLLLLLAQFDYDARDPLSVEESALEVIEGADFRELSYASPHGGRVPAYLIAPQADGPHAGIVFVHWGQGNRSEFVSEALVYAQAGAVSLLIDAPHMRADYIHDHDQADVVVPTITPNAVQVVEHLVIALLVNSVASDHGVVLPVYVVGKEAYDHHLRVQRRREGLQHPAHLQRTVAADARVDGHGVIADVANQLAKDIHKGALGCNM